jgi:hypothetical protein
LAIAQKIKVQTAALVNIRRRVAFMPGRTKTPPCNSRRCYANVDSVRPETCHKQKSDSLSASGVHSKVISDWLGHAWVSTDATDSFHYLLRRCCLFLRRWTCSTCRRSRGGRDGRPS